MMNYFFYLLIPLFTSSLCAQSPVCRGIPDSSIQRVFKQNRVKLVQLVYGDHPYARRYSKSHEYNEDGYVIDWKFSFGGGYKRRSFERDSAGRATKIIEYDNRDNDKITFCYLYKYDDTGRKIESQTKYPDGKSKTNRLPRHRKEGSYSYTTTINPWGDSTVTRSYTYPFTHRIIYDLFSYESGQLYKVVSSYEDYDNENRLIASGELDYDQGLIKYFKAHPEEMDLLSRSIEAQLELISDEKIAPPEQVMQDSFCYNEQGLLHKEYDGIFSTHQVYQYNKQGLPSKLQEFNSLEQLVLTFEYFYDEKGLLIRTEERTLSKREPEVAHFRYEFFE